MPGLPRSPARRTKWCKMVAEFDKRRKIVVAGLNKLPGISCATPKGAFYAFPNVKRTGWKAKALAASLLEDTGVAIIGGPDFGILGEGYMRAVLRQLDREHPEGARPHGRVSVEPQGGVIPFRPSWPGLPGHPRLQPLPTPQRHGRPAKSRCATSLREPPCPPHLSEEQTLMRQSLPRLRRRRGHPVHSRQLAARMVDDAGRPAAAGNPRGRRESRRPHPRRAGGIRRHGDRPSNRSADLRADFGGDRARRFRARRQAGAELESLGAAAQPRAAAPAGKMVQAAA